MIIPVLCFTCGKVIGNKYEKYKTKVEEGEEKAVVLDLLGIRRYCCRRMFLTHVDITYKLLLYSKANEEKSDEKY